MLRNIIKRHRNCLVLNWHVWRRWFFCFLKQSRHPETPNKFLKLSAVSVNFQMSCLFLNPSSPIVLDFIVCSAWQILCNFWPPTVIKERNENPEKRQYFGMESMLVDSGKICIFASTSILKRQVLKNSMWSRFWPRPQGFESLCDRFKAALVAFVYNFSQYKEIAIKRRL